MKVINRPKGERWKRGKGREEEEERWTKRVVIYLMSASRSIVDEKMSKTDRINHDVLHTSRSFFLFFFVCPNILTSLMKCVMTALSYWMPVGITKERRLSKRKEISVDETDANKKSQRICVHFFPSLPPSRLSSNRSKRYLSKTFS